MHRWCRLLRLVRRRRPTRPTWRWPSRPSTCAGRRHDRPSRREVARPALAGRRFAAVARRLRARRATGWWSPVRPPSATSPRAWPPRRARRAAPCPRTGLGRAGRRWSPTPGWWSAATPASRTWPPRTGRRRWCCSARCRRARWGPPPDRPYHRAIWHGTRADRGDAPGPGVHPGAAGHRRRRGARRGGARRNAMRLRRSDLEPSRDTAGAGPARASPTWTPTASRSTDDAGDRADQGAGHPAGLDRTSGSAPTRAGTSRPPGTTRPAASSTSTTRSGAAPRTRRSSTTRWRSPSGCRSCAPGSARDLCRPRPEPGPGCSPRSPGCSTWACSGSAATSTPTGTRTRRTACPRCARSTSGPGAAAWSWSSPARAGWSTPAPVDDGEVCTVLRDLKRRRAGEKRLFAYWDRPAGVARRCAPTRSTSTCARSAARR